MSNEVINPIDYGAYSEGADLPDQQLEGAGFRRLQHFNEHPLHKGTNVELGGYGIDDTRSDAPEIGPAQTIKHRSGNSTIMRAATTVDVALIGFSPKHYRIEYNDPAGALDSAGRPKRVMLISDRYVQPADMPGEKGRCRSSLAFFVALRVDGKRQLYETAFNGFVSDDATRLVAAAKGYAAIVAQQIALATKMATKPQTFMLWLPLSVGPSRMEGSVEQSAVSPPIWKIDENEDMMTRLVGGADFRAFVALRRELDTYLAQGRYGAPKASQAVQLPAAAAAVAAPRNTYTAGGDYAKDNGDVTV